MSLFRSAFNGIGSGAGVAWPLFGLVFSLVGGPIGSCLSLSLGILCILLFLSISLAIFYFSYKEKVNQQEQFFEKFQKNQYKLLNKIAAYLRIISNHSRQNKTPEERIAEDLQQASKQDVHSPLYQILDLCIQEIHPKPEGTLDRNKLIDHVSKRQGIRLKPPLFQWVASAFIGFVSTFGSIAGCSAGISGLLTGLGLFTSFAVFPWLGWGIIGASVICGVLMAIEATRGFQEEFQLNALDYTLKKMRHQLNKIIFKHQIDSTLYSKFALLNSPLEEKKLFALLNKPIIRLFHKHKNDEVQDNSSRDSFDLIPGY